MRFERTATERPISTMKLLTILDKRTAMRKVVVKEELDEAISVITRKWLKSFQVTFYRLSGDDAVEDAREYFSEKAKAIEAAENFLNGN